MKKDVRLSTRTRIILTYVLSLLGIACSFSYDVTNLFVSDIDKGAWWSARVTVLKFGYVFFLFALKMFEGRAVLNIIFNIGIVIILSDIIGRITGDTDRGISDYVFALLISLLCYYEYRKRRLHNS